MIDPAEDILDHLESSVSGVDFTGWENFIGLQPEKPVRCVTIRSTGGYPGAPNYQYDKPTVQVIVRHDVYATGYAMAQAIKQELHGQNNITYNGTRYIQILCEGDVIPSRIDKEKHPEFSVNFAVHRTPEA